MPLDQAAPASDLLSPTTSSAGGVTLVQSGGAMVFQKNGATVASESKIDFEVNGANAWTVTDDSANGRVKIYGPYFLVGYVGETGTILGGSGFSVSHPSTGLYTVTYTTGFAGTGIVICQVVDTSGAAEDGCSLTAISASSFTVELFNTNTRAVVNQGFMFAAFTQV